MKKTLAAVAVLGAFAGSAMAADVQLYGRIDSGMVYTHTDKGAVEADALSMESGWVTGSRWGIKGQEDLGNGTKVGFVLESGFAHDDGTSSQGGRLFGREAVVTISGDYGTFYMGRLGSIVSDSGSISLLGNASVFGNAYGTASMKYTTGAAMNRYDNVIAYVSPKFGGLDVRAMFSSKADTVTKGTNKLDVKDAGDEFSGDTNRYAAIGLNYAAGPLTLVATADYVLYGNAVEGQSAAMDDGLNIVVGGNYKLDCATVYGKVAYFDNADMGTKLTAAGLEKGYGIELGAKVPALGGDVLASVGYRDAEAVASDAEYDLWNINLGYNYAFSKRTSVYGAVGYHVEEDNTTQEVKAYQVGVGLIHKF